MLINILIVNDSAADRLIIKNMLSNYNTLTACDGKEAMQMLEEHEEINMMILDLNMPNMDGFQVLEALKTNDKYKKIRTIILTNYDELENEKRGLKLGAIDYIRKPIHIDSLRVRIAIHAELFRIQNSFENKLYEQGLTFDTIFQQAPIGIAISHNVDPFSSDNLLVRINPVFEKITGRSVDELKKIGWAQITHPDDIEEDINNFKKLQQREISSYAMQKRYIKPDGSIVWVDMVVASLTISNDERYNHICLIQDITRRKKLEEQLLESERSKSVLLSNLPGMAYRCKYDRKWTMLFVSDGCYELTGYTPESLLYNKDLSFNDLITPEYRDILWREWDRKLGKKTPFKYEYEITTATGKRKWVLEMGQGVYNDDGEIVALEGIIFDISDRKQMEDNLRYINEHDKWTGLYNRDYLEAMLANDAKKRISRKRALMSINLSTVQRLSANYGFHYTQNLIKSAADALRKYCSKDCMLFQTYENRFVFYIKNYQDKEELIDFCKNITNTLDSLFMLDRIGGGIGILEINQDDEVNVDLMLRRLLISSERSINLFDKGFKACFYDKELEAYVNREREILEELTKVATGENEGTLFLQYQPILDLNTNKICGFEALARLKTKKLGLVSPLEFIPIAEKTKLIIPLGEIIFIESLRFLNRLKAKGFDSTDISINVSAIQLLRPDFIHRIEEIISEMNVNPHHVGIEITESVFSSDYEYINNVITELKSKGLHIAIDDFGTGYSSMARGELSVNCLKIDKYFIDKLMVIEPDKLIIGDIISMAHRLGHSVIAEGVEYSEQKHYLLENGCDKVQGYLVSKPLDEDDAINILKSQFIIS